VSKPYDFFPLSNSLVSKVSELCMRMARLWAFLVSPLRAMQNREAMPQT